MFRLYFLVCLFDKPWSLIVLYTSSSNSPVRIQNKSSDSSDNEPNNIIYLPSKINKMTIE